MKKFIITIFTFTLFFTSLSLAEGPFKQENHDLNIGIGFGSTLYGNMVLPPISASYEVPVHENISVGGYFGFAMTDYGHYDLTWKYTHIVIGGRGSYHFYNKDNIDAYGGLMLGYNIVSFTSPSGATGDYSTANSSMTYSLYLGGRYYFTDTFGAFVELGYGVAYLTAGITMKF